MESILGLKPLLGAEIEDSKDDRYTIEEKIDINFLMRMALEKVNIFL